MQSCQHRSSPRPQAWSAHPAGSARCRCCARPSTCTASVTQVCLPPPHAPRHIHDRIRLGRLLLRHILLKRLPHKHQPRLPTQTSHALPSAAADLGRQIHRPQIVLVGIVAVELRPSDAQQLLEAVALAHVRQVLDRLARKLQPQSLDRIPYVWICLLSHQLMLWQLYKCQTLLGSRMRAFGATLLT